MKSVLWIAGGLALACADYLYLNARYGSGAGAAYKVPPGGVRQGDAIVVEGIAKGHRPIAVPAEIGGYVGRLLQRPGQRVSRGTALLEMSPDWERERLQNAEAALGRAQEAKKAAARRLAQAETELARLSQAASGSGRAGRAAAAGLPAARKARDARVQAMSESNRRVAELEAQVASLKTRTQRTLVTAPCDGFVLKYLVLPRSFLPARESAANARPVLLFADTSHSTVEAQVSPELAEELRLKQIAWVEFPNRPGRMVLGQLAETQSTAVSWPPERRINLRVETEALPDVAADGLPCILRIPLGSAAARDG
jgi:multidrug efflux pump subunit AcrA (membrane-fusion protein)